MPREHWTTLRRLVRRFPGIGNPMGVVPIGRGDVAQDADIWVAGG